MKKSLIFLIPGLLLLNACNEGRVQLSNEEAAVLEDSLASGGEDSRSENEAEAHAPQVDGSDLPEAPPVQQAPLPSDDSQSLGEGLSPAQGPTTLTPAHPPSSSDDNQPQAEGPGFHFEKVDSSGQIQQFQDPNVNLSAKAGDQGTYQATGSRPQVTEAATLAVYDPFCNCYKTGPNQDPLSIQDAKIPSLGVQDPALGLSSTSNEDEDSDD
ncbi:MAG TPA: hypothetical protein VFW62_06230 [bacterium]|nr:hypothetical protein [bacterium]